MKTIKTTLLLVFILCLISTISLAQQAYLIHQDNVKPSMMMEYEKIAKEFNEACAKYNPQSPWVTASTSDFNYLYITPMENFAELDTNVFAGMAKEMGDDFGNMFDRFDKCYDSHSDYIITLSESLTYMPEGISQTQEGEDYRNWYYIYFTPENGKNLYEAMKGVKDMFTSKSSKSYYRVYRSGFGCAENYYIVALSSKSELDSAMKTKANEELLGEERFEVFGNMLKYVSRMEEVTGEMRPDLSYSPKEE